jgi:hypothetical protein
MKKTTWDHVGRISKMGKKTLARLTIVLDLLAKPECYPYVASWQVVICTPAFAESSSILLSRAVVSQTFIVKP